MKIEVGDTIYAKSFGVGYVTEEVKETGDLIVAFLGNLKTYGFSPYDKRVSLISKHCRFTEGDLVFCGRLGAGCVVESRDKAIYVSFDYDDDNPQRYNPDGTLCCDPRNSSYRLFSRHEIFIPFVAGKKNETKKVINDVIKKLAALLEDTSK